MIFYSVLCILHMYPCPVLRPPTALSTIKHFKYIAPPPPPPPTAFVTLHWSGFVIKKINRKLACVLGIQVHYMYYFCCFSIYQTVDRRAMIDRLRYLLFFLGLKTYRGKIILAIKTRLIECFNISVLYSDVQKFWEAILIVLNSWN